MTVVSIAATNRPVRSAVGVVAVPWRWTLCDLDPLVSGKTTVLRRERLGTGHSFGFFLHQVHPLDISFWCWNCWEHSTLVAEPGAPAAFDSAISFSKFSCKSDDPGSVSVQVTTALSSITDLLR